MNANDRQEGGTHYQENDMPQHWDLAIGYQWDPFQYQITKYVMRWKDKHKTPAERLEDLKKARHFIDKYIEVAHHYDPYKPDFDDYIDKAVEHIIGTSEDGDAGPGYVDQDRPSEERLPGCLDDTPCAEGQVRLRPGGPCVPDTGRQR